MSQPLFDPAPDSGQPIAVLKHAPGETRRGARTAVSTNS